MAAPIAIYYHAYTRQGSPLGLAIVTEQLTALQQSGLLKAASEIHIGCEASQQLEIAMLAAPVAAIHPWPDPVQSELPTLRLLVQNLVPGWHILYHHTKGSSRPTDSEAPKRRSMTLACIERWRSCVRALENGFDTAGEQWLNPVKSATYPPGQRYWAGNFWWATSDYLLTLEPLVQMEYRRRSERINRYEAEAWIGKSPRPPRTFRCLE